MASPLVTVLLASYNHRAYVSAAIKSILDQSYPEVELIVIDDGSTDGSQSDIQKLADLHGFTFIAQENAGLVSVFNRGVALARGKYFLPHASDDISLPGRIAAQVRVLEQYAHAGFTSGNIVYIDANGRPLSVKRRDGRRGTIYTFDDFFLFRADVTAVAMLYRTSVLKAVCPLDPSIRFEDVQAYLAVTSAGPDCVVWEDTPLLHCRVLPDSLGRSNKARLGRDLLRLLTSYRDHPHYSEAVRLAKIRLLSALAEETKFEALRLLWRERLSLNLRQAVPLAVKLVLPRQAIVAGRELRVRLGQFVGA